MNYLVTATLGKEPKKQEFEALSDAFALAIQWLDSNYQGVRITAGETVIGAQTIRDIHRLVESGALRA